MERKFRASHFPKLKLQSFHENSHHLRVLNEYVDNLSNERKHGAVLPRRMMRYNN